MHVFPDLKRLERKYAKELMVIGVHSAKFTNEKDSDAIRNAILRHGLEHPVVNDAEFKIFRAYGAKGWPHFVLVDPEGGLVGQTGGEGRYDVLDGAIAKLVRAFDEKIDRKPRTFTLEKSKVKDGALSYPGKIVATAERLYIADTNHNRIVVADPAGKVLEVVGGSEEGFKDGDFKAARFFQPQGLALRGESLFVADTENHSIRKIDFETKTVKTIAGTGKQRWSIDVSGPGTTVGLNSPWDLALEGTNLFIAMAGNHQIWKLDLKSGVVGPFSGSGHEDIEDGAHAKAKYAQPSGLSIMNGKLYVADSEVSGLREVDLDSAGGARTIVGMGLFEFGDKDGAGDEVRMQHVIGVHGAGGKLYVCDSYNHKIKRVGPGTRAVTTLYGSGHPGHQDGDGQGAEFWEPGGLAVAGERLYVADTNNHAVRVVDLRSGEVRTLAIG
jgi:hypothetical protein